MLLHLGFATYGQVLPMDPLPGPVGSATGFGVAEVRDLGVEVPVSDISGAVDLVRNGYEGFETVKFGEHARLDVADFARRPFGGEILAGPALDLLNDTSGEETPNTVSVAKGRLRVSEPGQYTIQVHSSDGFAMRIPGFEWDEVHSWRVGDTAEIDPLDPETIVFPVRTGDVNTRGVITLPQGDIDFEFLHFGGGLSYLTGVYYEVTSAKGNFEFQSSAQWLPLGVGAVVEEISPAPRHVQLKSPALMVTADEVARNMTEVRESVEFARELEEQTQFIDQLVVVDDNGVNGRDVCCDRPALALPTSEASLISYVDRRTFVGTGVFGEFIVDDGDSIPGEELPLTFAVFGDDLAQLRIPGHDFALGSDAAQLRTLETGEVGIWAFLATMWQHPVAQIELTEGEYDIEALLLQQSGDAGLEVWVSTGLHEQFDINTFYPLGMSEQTTARPRNVGLKLVDPTAPVSGDFDNDGAITVDDVNTLSQAVVDLSVDEQFDINMDGIVESADVDALLSLAGKLNGDANFDGAVEFGDFLVLAKNFRTSNRFWSEGDFNSSGSVEFGDFLVMATNFGKRAATISSVPEPTLGGAMIGVMIAICVLERRTCRHE